jgi:hypothetical protein
MAVLNKIFVQHCDLQKFDNESHKEPPCCAVKFWQPQGHSGVSVIIKADPGYLILVKKHFLCESGKCFLIVVC